MADTQNEQADKILAGWQLAVQDLKSAEFIKIGFDDDDIAKRELAILRERIAYLEHKIATTAHYAEKWKKDLDAKNAALDAANKKLAAANKELDGLRNIGAAAEIKNAAVTMMGAISAATSGAKKTAKSKAAKK